MLPPLIGTWGARRTVLLLKPIQPISAGADRALSVGTASVRTSTVSNISLKLDHRGVNALPNLMALRTAHGIDLDCTVARDLGSEITVLLYEKVGAATDVDVFDMVIATNVANRRLGPPLRRRTIARPCFRRFRSGRKNARPEGDICGRRHYQYYL